LALVETPDATRSFKPVPHIELIDTLEHVLKLNHIAIRKEQFALRRDGSTLFGVLQLAYEDTPDGGAAFRMLPMLPKLNRKRALFVLTKIDEFLAGRFPESPVEGLLPHVDP
jgi:microcystin degradation protein MlrC